MHNIFCKAVYDNLDTPKQLWNDCRTSNIGLVSITFSLWHWLTIRRETTINVYARSRKNLSSSCYYRVVHSRFLLISSTVYYETTELIESHHQQQSDVLCRSVSQQVQIMAVLLRVQRLKNQDKHKDSITFTLHYITRSKITFFPFVYLLIVSQ